MGPVGAFGGGDEQAELVQFLHEIVGIVGGVEVRAGGLGAGQQPIGGFADRVAGLGKGSEVGQARPSGGQAAYIIRERIGGEAQQVEQGLVVVGSERADGVGIFEPVIERDIAAVAEPLDQADGFGQNIGPRDADLLGEFAAEQVGAVGGGEAGVVEGARDLAEAADSAALDIGDDAVAHFDALERLDAAVGGVGRPVNGDHAGGAGFLPALPREVDAPDARFRLHHVYRCFRQLPVAVAQIDEARIGAEGAGEAHVGGRRV